MSRRSKPWIKKLYIEALRRSAGRNEPKKKCKGPKVTLNSVKGAVKTEYLSILQKNKGSFIP